MTSASSVKRSIDYDFGLEKAITYNKNKLFSPKLFIYLVSFTHDTGRNSRLVSERTDCHYSRKNIPVKSYFAPMTNCAYAGY